MIVKLFTIKACQMIAPQISLIQPVNMPKRSFLLTVVEENTTLQSFGSVLKGDTYSKKFL